MKQFLRAAPILWLLVRREFRARYAGSTLGVVWNAIHPVVLIAIYILVFSKIMADRAGGGSRLEYAAHLTSGMIPWFFFSEVVARSTTVLVDNANFLKKMALPAEILHASVFINSFIIHGASLLVLALLLALAGMPIHFNVLLALPVMILLGIVAFGVGLVFSVLHLVLRDVGQFVTIGLQFLFWLTPIVYFVSILPERVATLLKLNPILGYISYIQRLFGSQGHAFVLESYPLMLLLPFGMVLIGHAFLRRHRAEMLDLL